jgi:O-antigen/teichoic acid export membrane protein
VIAAAIARARRYGWAIVAPGFTLLSAFAMNAIASRQLGPAGFGQFAVASTLVTLLGIVGALGVPTTLVTLSGGRSRDSAADPVQMRRWRAAGVAIVWIASVIILAGLLFFELLLGEGIARWFPVGTALAIAMASAGTALLEVALAESQRDFAFRRYFARMFGGSLARLGGVAIAVIVFIPSARGAVWGYALATFVSGAALSWGGTRAALAAMREGAADLGAAISRMFAHSAPVVGSAIVVAAMSWIDTLVIAGYMAPSDVGTYAAAVRLTIIPSTLIGGITSLALPMASRAWFTGRVDEYNRRALPGGLAVGVLVVGALCLAAGLLVRLVYGTQFGAAAPVFAVLAIGMLPNFACNPMSQLLFASGRTRTLLVIQAVQLAAMLVGLGLLASGGSPIAIAWMRTGVNIAATATIMGFALRLGRHAPVLVTQS